MPGLIDYVMTASQVSRIASDALEVPIKDLDVLLAQWEREETLLPLLDPTAYIHRPRVIEKRIEVIRAFTTFRKAIEKHKDLWSHPEGQESDDEDSSS